MTILVADVGGTNTRLALVDGSGSVGETIRFLNDDFATFPALLAAYAARCAPPVLSGCCIAIAGPVTEEIARLTNRDWHFDRSDIAAALPGLLPGSVRLINDLAALGHALPALTSLQLADIRKTPATKAGNGQAVVMGLGTGVNICLAKTTALGNVVIEAELGHASLPQSVSDTLSAAIGIRVADFPTVEELFAGRGLSRLYGILSGQTQRAGQAILAEYDRGAAGKTAETVDLMAGLLGRMARELVYMYQPFGGIHFAGSVARGILGSAARARFLACFEAPGRFDDHIARVPVRVIVDDAAALTGAAQVCVAE
ncbi:glucokinase [Sedimentitalea sp. XS_ASV28]|uniref:glucokinase n=1 Tax=Sedimentitalea sp. XS_ASV28 TaxID=3241296 RepID=UPI0035173F28